METPENSRAHPIASSVKVTGTFIVRHPYPTGPIPNSPRRPDSPHPVFVTAKGPLRVSYPLCLSVQAERLNLCDDTTDSARFEGEESGLGVDFGFQIDADGDAAF